MKPISFLNKYLAWVDDEDFAKIDQFSEHINGNGLDNRRANLKNINTVPPLSSWPNEWPRSHSWLANL